MGVGMAEVETCRDDETIGGLESGEEFIGDAGRKSKLSCPAHLNGGCLSCCRPHALRPASTRVPA